MKLSTGQTAYVSGGGAGIGRAIAAALAARGLGVGVVDRDRAAAEQTAAQIVSDGGRALAVVADVGDAAAVEAAADAIDAAFGPVHVVCNNAGVLQHGVRIEDVGLADWDRLLRVNLYGVINGVRSFVPRLRARGGPGHIVNTASIGGFLVNPSYLTGAYCTSKYAVVGLSEGLRAELEGSGIGVSVLAPGLVDTAINLPAPDQEVRPDAKVAAEFARVLRSGQRPEAIAQAVLRAIEEDRFYIFTHPETKARLADWHGCIMAGFDPV